MTCLLGVVELVLVKGVDVLLGVEQGVHDFFVKGRDVLAGRGAGCSRFPSWSQIDVLLGVEVLRWCQGRR